ncbi:hypothetical protein CKA32_007141 [Geitlerinema sp. FC II]|nr:hypothetical protein CKA32_007141 [Geitlerinema sp. FC II]
MAVYIMRKEKDKEQQFLQSHLMKNQTKEKEKPLCLFAVQ